ncbi:AAEL004539-PA [Aedes aegypti]|uniref:AAEL004539-PA n=1 Tax=Aedes aegypti TaxID=7159 RepID=Q17CN2_AEDAE|nr:AAEL004539-PA [Aedes aegypti]
MITGFILRFGLGSVRSPARGKSSADRRLACVPRRLDTAMAAHVKPILRLVGKNLLNT